MKSVAPFIVAAGLAFLATGCHHTIAKSTPPTPPPAAPAPTVSVAASPQPVQPPAPALKAVPQISDEQLFARNVKDIFFNYDNADIRNDEQAKLDADARFLAAHPDWQLLIEGHCDERGSEDYNMALGQNRAKDVQDGLVRQGISSDRIKLISYGKERPFCTTAENDSCWSQNRRAHFVLQKKQQAGL